MIMDAEKDQSGQALIELIIFLPLLFTLYSMISGFASAINGSINQQKVTRSYFYFRAQNNSMLPKPDEGKTFLAWRKFGMYMIGWKDYFEGGDSPVMPCYRISIPLTPGNGDKCGERYTTESTQYIRVATVYGICGATFMKNSSSNSVFYAPDMRGVGFEELVDVTSCLIR
jgi:hypothetical protein